MPSPWFDPKTKIAYLRVRPPSDLADSVKGQKITLPTGELIDNAPVVRTVTIGEFVKLSLSTRDPKEARIRYSIASAGLQAHWRALRSGPRELTSKEQTALAGVYYQEQLAAFEEHPRFDELRQQFVYLGGFVPRRLTATDMTPQMQGTLQAMSDSGWGHVVEAFVGNRTLSADMAETYFGKIADSLLARHSLIVSKKARASFLQELFRAFIDCLKEATKVLQGDYRPDEHASRFPPIPDALRKPLTASQGRSGEILSIMGLYDLRLSKGAKRTEATFARYRTSVKSLNAFVKGKNYQEITESDVWGWIEHRQNVDGVAAVSINKNDLVAISSLYRWAMSGDPAKRLASSNPAETVKADEPSKKLTRPKAYRDDEQKKILRAALLVEIDERNPTKSYALKWCPWLCAYSGARIAEITALKAEDIAMEHGHWVMKIGETKTGEPRDVPIHDHLIELGFLKFKESIGSGPLFVNPSRAKSKAPSTSLAQQRSSDVSAWVRDVVGITDKAISPSHAWRHTFKSRATGVMSDTNSDLITGHRLQGAAGGYKWANISTLAAEMNKFPRYKLR